ncbi:iron-containing alcohol dehydrogenase [Azospirillum sp.]|uniref:iron-containing alcohol dehydrogenase n=1 Tax=Azospirillum sp. TaxID=34012 RepID=UPI002D6638FA|nr:iron-containing alcohol dehydrogenase [Azospirillum sp.]HYD69164.1 iron-containing alcohol dehydrogenase [Azospirillum sp.]
MDAVAGGSLALLRQPVVHYGARLADALPRIVAERGCARVLPVVTGSLRRHPVVEQAIAALGNTALPVFGDLKPHTPFTVVLDLAAEIDRAQPDLIVAVGGGSALDAAKVGALAANAGAADHDALLALRSVPGAQGEMRPSPVGRVVPIVAVPTTLSAAEFGMIGGATDTTTGIKHIYKSDNLAPDVVVFDPWLTAATPAGLWLSTGVRSLDHGIETVLSRDANPFTDALALRGLTLLGEGLRQSHTRPDDVEARHRCQLGVWLAACGIGRVRYGASHGLGHQLGALAGVPHGLTSCVLLPAVLAYTEPVSAGRQAWIAEALGGPGRPAAEVVRGLIAALGLPTRLSDLGVAAETLPRVAESALGNAFVKANLRPVTTVDDAMAILRAAF